MGALWKAEPVAIVNAVRLVCLAGMTFGLHMDTTQLVASMTALEAVLTLFQRSAVVAPDTHADIVKAMGTP